MARSTSGADYQNVPRPVAAMARDLPPRHEIDWHQHPRFQVIYGTEGVMRVDTHDETWFVPPPAAELPARLSTMLAFANRDSDRPFLHPLLRAIILHFWMAYLHPFVFYATS